MRICPDCQARELDYRQKFCSECSENRRYFSNLLKNEKWKNNNPEKYRECYTKRNNSEKHKIRFKKWRQTEEAKKKHREESKLYYYNVVKPKNVKKKTNGKCGIPDNIITRM